MSLVIITATAFVYGSVFYESRRAPEDRRVHVFVAAFLSGYGNWLPQVEGGFPPKEEKLNFSSMSPQQLADEGEKIIFGGIGQNKVQGAIGKGQCPLCHAFHAGMLGERAPNLLGLPERAGKERLEDPRYSKGNPAKREYAERKPVRAAVPPKPGRNTSPNPMRVPIAMWSPVTV